MILSNHEIDFNVSQTGSTVHDLGPLRDRCTSGDDTPGLLPIASFMASTPVFQVKVKPFESFFPLSVPVFGVPDPLVKALMADRTFSRLNSLFADDLRTPFLVLEHLSRIFLHLVVKLQQLGLDLMTLIGFRLGSLCLVEACIPTSSGRISPQLPRDGRGMDSDLLGYKFLLDSCLEKGFNLIPLYQTELGVIFCHRNAKIALLSQTAKSP